MRAENRLCKAATWLWAAVLTVTSSQRFWVVVMWVAIALFAVWYWQHPHVMNGISRRR